MSLEWIDRLQAQLETRALNAEVIVMGGMRLIELDANGPEQQYQVHQAPGGGVRRRLCGVPVVMAAASAPGTIVEIHYRNWDGLPGFDMLDITG